MADIMQTPKPKKTPLAQQQKKTAAATTPAVKRPRALVLSDICEHLTTGETLEEACRRVADAPHPSTVLKWTESDPDGAGQLYAQARARGYLLLGDRIDELARETTAMTRVHAQGPDGQYLYAADGVTPLLKEVVVPLSADVMASKRLQVDTLKWKLSKMLPKIYGDKIVNEHTGKDGGPIALAAVDLKNLSDDELAQMQALMGKVTTTTGGAK